MTLWTRNILLKELCVGVLSLGMRRADAEVLATGQRQLLSVEFHCESLHGTCCNKCSAQTWNLKVNLKMDPNPSKLPNKPLFCIPLRSRYTSYGEDDPEAP